jgi:predicted permease
MWRLFRRDRFERDMDEELAFHLQSRIDDHVRRGLSPADAERRARLEFGGVDKYKEQIRDGRPLGPLEDLGRDLTYAWRSLRRTPVFALTAIIAIALGVAVNTGLVTLVYALVLRPLPVKDPGTIRNVFMATHGSDHRGTFGTPYVVSYAEFLYMRSHARTAELAAIAEASLSCACGMNGTLAAQLVSDNLLPLIGATPVVGRFFTPQEAATPGATPVVVLSWTTWQQRFGGAADVVGRTVVMNRTPFTIVGVADERATGPLVRRPDVWVPYTMQALTRPGEVLISKPTVGWIQMIARRKPDANDAAMRAELAVLGQQSLLPHNPHRTAIVTVAPGAFLNYPMIMSNGAPVMALLFVAVSFVLLIACANVVNMLLARGFARRREIAIRLAMGAGRMRLLRQFLTESALVGLIGGTVGLALSQIAARMVVASIPADQIGAHQLDLSPDWRILAYTLAVSFITSLVFGIVPALRLLRTDLMPSVKTDRGDLPTSRRRVPLQSVLIATQATVSLALLVNAGLLVRAFDRAVRMDLGQSARNVLIASMNLRQEQYTAERAERLLTDVRDNASRWPGVIAASMTTTDPFVSACGMVATTIEATGSRSPGFQVACDRVGPDYFQALRIPILRGRGFTGDDIRSVSAIAVIDEWLARERFGDRNPLGQHIEIERGRDLEIVGVVAPTQVLQLGTTKAPKVYTPLRGGSFLEAKMLVGHHGATEAVASALRQRAAELDPSLVVSVKPIEQNVSTALMPLRILAGAGAALGGLGLVLACTGLYGVVAFTVSRRQREIGIRVALGADRSSVLRMILGHGLRPVVAGCAIGLLLAAGGGHLIRALLFGVSPIDPITFATTALGLLGAATLAAIVPALAALRLDPMIALRDE